MNVCKAIPAQTEGGCRKVETYQMCILFLLIITLPAWGEHLSMIAFFVVVVLTIQHHLRVGLEGYKHLLA